MTKFTYTYIFFAETPYGIGGSQKYISAKSRWLIDRGWQVLFVFSSLGQVAFDFSNVETYHFPLMMCRPRFAPKAKVERLMTWLYRLAGDSSRVVVESSSFDYSFWGEYAAKRLGATHLLFSLDEVPPRLSDDEKRFFEFKLKRNELAGIKSSCLKRVFCDKSESDLEKSILVARTGSYVQEVPFDVKLPEADKRIGVVSRLDKSFVPLAYEAVARFARANPEFTYNFVVIGDTSDIALKRSLSKKVEGIRNLIVSELGFFNPLPKGLLKKLDIAIAKAGCTWACVTAGVPTAVYAMDADVCMGLMGVDCYRNPSASDGSEVDLAGLLQRVLLDKCLEDIDWLSSLILPNPDVGFGDHMIYLESASRNVEYWDVEKCRTTYLRVSTSFLTLACRRYPLELIRKIKLLISF